jgi:hypothetical protein
MNIYQFRREFDNLIWALYAKKYWKKIDFHSTKFLEEINGLIGSHFIDSENVKNIDSGLIEEFYQKIGVAILKSEFDCGENSGKIALSEELKKELFQECLDLIKNHVTNSRDDEEALNASLDKMRENLIGRLEEQSKFESIFTKNLTDATKEYFETLTDLQKPPEILCKNYIEHCKSKSSINFDFLVVRTDFKDKIMEIRDYVIKNKPSSESSKGLAKLIDRFVQFVLSIFKQSRQDKFEEQSKIKTSELVDVILKEKKQFRY